MAAMTILLRIRAEDARRGNGHERGRGPSNERGRGRDKSADRSTSRERGEVMCFACDNTDHRAGDLKCPKLAPKSRAAIQRRAELSEDNKGGKVIRELKELKELRKEK